MCLSTSNHKWLIPRRIIQQYYGERDNYNSRFHIPRRERKNTNQKEPLSAQKKKSISKEMPLSKRNLSKSRAQNTTQKTLLVKWCRNFNKSQLYRSIWPLIWIHGIPAKEACRILADRRGKIRNIPWVGLWKLSPEERYVVGDQNLGSAFNWERDPFGGAV